MHTPDTTLEIRTFGRFSISVSGRAAATAWPDETVRLLFCSLLAPLDLYVTWDRLCRSMFNEPATLTTKRHMVESLILPLTAFLIRELGFDPLIAGDDGIRIDHHRIHVDAIEFHNSALEGLRLMSNGNRAAAFGKFSSAELLYQGTYLPGLHGKIIDNTRNDLESLYKLAILAAMPLIRSSCYSGRNRRVASRPVLKNLRRSAQPIVSYPVESVSRG